MVSKLPGEWPGRKDSMSTVPPPAWGRGKKEVVGQNSYALWAKVWETMKQGQLWGSRVPLKK